MLPWLVLAYLGWPRPLDAQAAKVPEPPFVPFNLEALKTLYAQDDRSGAAKTLAA